MIGIVSSYLLNSLIVFRQPPKWHKLFQFPLVYIVQYLVSLIVMLITVEYFGFNEHIAYLLAIVLTIPLTFAISRFIITGAKSGKIAEHEANN